MTEYEQAKSVDKDLKLNKQMTITTENVSNFRRYISLLAMKSGKKYITKVLEKNGKDVLLIRIK